MTSLQIQTPSKAWQFAFIGAIASVPVTYIINWLPNSETSIGGSIMVVGAFIAGVIAKLRLIDSSAAGLRAGFIGAIFEISIFLINEGNSVLSSQHSIVFWVIGMGIMGFGMVFFGLLVGSFGGWVTNLAMND